MVAPPRGGASPDRCAKPGGRVHWGTRALPQLSWQADLLSDGPQDCTQFAGDGHHDWVGDFAPCAEGSRPFAQPHLRFPTDILEAFGHLFQLELERSTHVGRVARGPGALE
jgi:hypothetical protein